MTDVPKTISAKEMRDRLLDRLQSTDLRSRVAYRINDEIMEGASPFQIADAVLSVVAPEPRSRLVVELERLLMETLAGLPPTNPVLALILHVVVANQEREWFTEVKALEGLSDDLGEAMRELVREAQAS